MSKADRPSDAVTDSFLQTLVFDVAAAAGRHKLHESQQNSRDLIRTTLAAVEGVVWAYRVDVISTARSLDSMTQLDEFAFMDSNYQITEQGHIVRQPRFISLLAMIRLATRLAVRIDPALEVRFDTAGWNDLRESIKVRNRVTHPKSENDLLINAAEIAACQNGFFWLLEVYCQVLKATNGALGGYAETVRKMLDGLNRGDPDIWAAYRAAQISDE